MADLVAEAALEVHRAGHVGHRGGQRAVGKTVEAQVQPGVGQLGEGQALRGERLTGVGHVEQRRTEETARRGAEDLVDAGAVHRVVFQVEQTPGRRVGRAQQEGGGLGEVDELEQHHGAGAAADHLGEPSFLDAGGLADGDVHHHAADRFVGAGRCASHEQVAPAAVGGEEPHDRFHRHGGGALGGFGGEGVVRGRRRCGWRQRAHRHDLAERGQVVGMHDPAQGAGLAERRGVPAEDLHQRRRHEVAVGAGRHLAEQHHPRLAEGAVVLGTHAVGGPLDLLGPPASARLHGG